MLAVDAAGYLLCGNGAASCDGPPRLAAGRPRAAPAGDGAPGRLRRRRRARRRVQPRRRRRRRRRAGRALRPRRARGLSRGGTAVRILLVDDHAMVRSGLRLLLEEEGDIEVVGEAGDVDAALERARALAPTVILLDLNMPGRPVSPRSPSCSTPRPGRRGGGHDRSTTIRSSPARRSGRGDGLRAQGGGAVRARGGRARGRGRPAYVDPSLGARLATARRAEPTPDRRSCASARRSRATASTRWPAAAGWASSTGRPTSRSTGRSR